MRRVRTPTVLQMEAVECGVAALAMVLGYHGRFVPLETLRNECGVSRDGTDTESLIEVAARYGLAAAHQRCEPTPDDLGALPLPLIVHWNFTQFVVVEGFSQNRVYLNDPATGPCSVTREDFDESFTGGVLTFTRTEAFQTGGARSTVLHTLAARLAPCRTDLAYVIVAGVLLVLPSLLIPMWARLFVDRVLLGGFDNWVKPLLIGMACTAVMRGALSWLQTKYVARLETRLTVTMSSRFMWHVLRLPMDFFAQRYGGEIAARVAMNDQVAALLGGQLATTVIGLLSVVFFAAAMMRHDGELTAIGIGIAMINMLVLRAVGRRRADGYRRQLQQYGRMLATAMGGLQIIETLKASASESDFFSRWAGMQAALFNTVCRLSVFNRLLAFVGPLLASLNIVAILGMGGHRVMEGTMTVGTLVAFQSLMASFNAPFADLMTLGSKLQEIDGTLRRLEDVLRNPVDADLDAVYAEPPVRLSGRLELRAVRFGYNRGLPPLLDDFSLSLAPGARVALVGGSGSGKSTVSRLVAGLFNPWSGEVLFDGRPRRAQPRANLTGSVALVDQDTFLFAGSVRDNLTLWDSTIPADRVQRAARDACIHDEIAARSGGYDSPVEEAGTNFSGGQRQRLEIARALCIEPTLLILDEATSALDPVTEKRIDDNLRRRGCTCLIVAHRLSTIRDCDEIIVLERGRVVQRGTHEDLAAVEGLYRQLIHATDAMEETT